MKKLTWSTLALVLLALLPAAAEAKPNIVVLMTDDQTLASMSVMPKTRESLVIFAQEGGPLRFTEDGAAERRIVKLLQLIVSTREYQFG